MTTDILIVDDEPDIRDLIAGVLEDENYQARSAATAEKALEEVRMRAPGLVILDVWLQGSDMDGLSLLKYLKSIDPLLPVIVISGHGNIETAVAAIRRGAYDFIEKPFSDQVLLERIQQALQQDTSERSGERDRAEIERRAARLTARETQVFELVVAGKPNKVVASDLDLSQKTVEVHRAHVMEKMRAESFADLVKMAVTLDVTGPPRTIQ